MLVGILYVYTYQDKGRGLLFISDLRAVEGLNNRYINSSYAFFIFITSTPGIDGYLNLSLMG